VRRVTLVRFFDGQSFVLSALTLAEYRATLKHTEGQKEVVQLMPISVTQQRLAWGLQELSAATGLSLGLLRKQVRQGALRVTKVGRRRIVALEDWRAFLARHQNRAQRSE
jgi:hypothetical protein